MYLTWCWGRNHEVWLNKFTEIVSSYAKKYSKINLVNFFKVYFPQILLDSFLNTLSHIFPVLWAFYFLSVLKTFISALFDRSKQSNVGKFFLRTDFWGSVIDLTLIISALNSVETATDDDKIFFRSSSIISFSNLMSNL